MPEMNCQKCQGPFSDGYAYHNLLNNKLFCHKCAEEVNEKYTGTVGGSVEFAQVFAHAPVEVFEFKGRVLRRT